MSRVSKESHAQMWLIRAKMLIHDNHDVCNLLIYVINAASVCVNLVWRPEGGQTKHVHGSEFGQCWVFTLS